MYNRSVDSYLAVSDFRSGEASRALDIILHPFRARRERRATEQMILDIAKQRQAVSDFVSNLPPTEVIYL